MVDDRNETPDTPVAAGEGTAPITLNAAGVSTLTVPHGAMLLNAQFARAGTELQLTGQNGEQVMVQNFFGTEMAPVLMTEGGGKIMPDVAEALAGPDILGGGEGDATLMGQSDQPIGTVDTAEGGVFATRADGTRVELNEGDPVYQGDVLETDDTGAVSVTFIDNTEFALDEGARMTLDEMVFDANTGEGSSTFTVVQGVFTFVSGQVAKSGSDAMTVNTPVATIGIRGTKVAIKAGSEDEDTVITLLQEDSGHIGEIAVTNDAGTQVLNQANQTVFIESALVAPTQPAILPSEQLRSIFTDNANDTRGLWRYEEGEQGRNDGGDLEQTIDEAKEAAAEEGADEDTVDNAEAAAELAFELALAEGLDEEEALQEAAEAFQNALVDQGAADSLIETAAGGDDAGGPDDDFGGGDSVFDYNPSAGFGGTQGGLSQGGGGPGAPVTGFQPTSQNNTVFDPVIRGGAGDDTLTGTEGDDQFDAGAGNDTINALGGDDIVDAGAGNDTVFGGAGDDTIDGGTGNDTLHGGADDDDISGGAGNDTIFGGTGDDDIEGGDGNDTIFGGAGEDNIDAGDGDDFIGTSDDDGSDDVYDGGDGIDTVSFAADTEGVTVNLDEDDNDEFDIDANTARGDATGEDEIENVENIVTGSGDDVIIGQTGEANTINAGAGDDLVIGGEGDTLIGGAGTDTLRISMTRAEFEDPAFQAEVAAYRADPSTPFHFNSIDMDVETFELLQIEVDGTIIAAEPPTLSVGDVYGVEDSAILLGLGASLNDTDGAEVLEVQVSGLPEGSTLHFIDDNGVAQSIAITDGEGSIEISGASQALLDTLAVTPPAGDSGDFQINVTATAVEADGSISSVSDSFNVIVNGIPTVLPDSIAGTEDAGVLVGSLTDDIGGEGTFDRDSDDLEFSIDGVTADANGDYVVATPEGTLTLHADGTYEFAIDASQQSLDDGESAVAQFTIVATDNGQPVLFDDNTLTVTITGSNDGPVASAELVTGGEDAGQLTGNLDATDIDGDDLTFSLQGDGEGEYGQLTVNADGSYTFDIGDAAQGLDDGESAVETFTYEVTDGDVVSTQTIQVTITGSNDGPVAQAEAVSGSEDAGQLTGNLAATDIDGDSLTFSLDPSETGTGQYGDLTVNADGSYTFDLNAAAQTLDDGETAVETFTYQVSDGDETVTQAIQVTITGSNDAPVATAETIAGTEDSGVLSGNLDATDIDGENVTFTVDGHTPDANGVTTVPVQGTVGGQTVTVGLLIVAADGAYTFTPDNAALQGLGPDDQVQVDLTFTASDGTASDSDTLSITLQGTDDNLVALAEIVQGTEDSSVLTGNLDATDPEGGEISFGISGVEPDGTTGATTVAVQGTVNGETVTVGQLVVQQDGSYAFTPDNAALQGLDDGEEVDVDLTFTASDGANVSENTLSITLTGSNDGPVATAEVISGGEDAGQLTGNLEATDVEGDDLTFSLQGDGEGQYGQLTVNADGSYTFDIAEAAQGLDDGESAVETFTYEVTDGDVTSTQTISVTITGSNDGPVAQAEFVTGSEDAGTVTGNLTATDIDGDDLTFGLASGEDGAGQYGTLTVNADGSYSFAVNENAQSLDDGETAVETFTYQVSDGDETVTQTISVAITGSNDGPIAQAEAVTGGEDAGQLSGNLDATDVEGDDLTFSLQGDGAGQYGQLTVNADGSYTFDIAEAAQGLDDGESAVETFTYEVSDGDVTTTQTIQVTITGSNDGPVAQAESVSGGEDAGQLTGNLDAADVDGDDLTFSLQGDGEGQFGQLTVNADGSYTFDIAEAAQGLDDGESAVETFTYEVTDGDVTSTQTITVTITGSNDGPVAQAESVSGTEDAGQLTGNLDAADVDGDDLTFSLQGDGEGQYGQLTVNTDGSYTFDIASNAQSLDDGESVVETFTYEVTDGDVVSTQTIQVTITGSNDGPVAEAAAVTGTEDAGQLTGNLDAADVDGDDLTFSLQGDGEGQYGQLTVNADGSYTFDIAEAAQGLDDGESAVETFTYEVTDGDVVSTQTITVTITGSNDGPVAQAETVTGNEDAGQLTGNLDAADVDGDDLTFSLQGDGEGQYGQLTVNADGSYTFDIAEAAQGLDDGESAVETFTYEVTDGDVVSTQTITVTITGSNDGPVAQTEAVTGGEDAGQLTGNLDAADVDGDDLTFSLQGDGEGQYGQLTVNADGSYTFDIAEAAQGLDDGESAVETFTYEVTDGDVVSTQTIQVTITGSNDGPVAQAESVSGTEDAGQLTGNLDAADVDGDELTFSLQGDGEGQYGQLTVNADGSYTFDIAEAAQGLDDGESAVETFTYEVTDGDVTSTQTITVTITGSNDGPVAQVETVTGNEDAGLLTGNLDAADVDGDDLTFSLQGDGEGQYGQLTVNADGSYTFDIAEAAQGLDDGESAVETFTYEVTDGDVTSTQTITVTITGSNDGPVAQAESVSGNEDAGQLTGNLDAADVDGDDLTFSLQGDGEGQYGQLTVNADGSYTFDIAEAAQGLDDGESAVETFTYEVTDGDVTSTQTITVTITGSNDGPVAQAEAVSGSEDAGQLTGNLDAADVDGDDLTFSLQGDGEGQYGQLTVNADGSYTFDIAEAAQGLDDGESAVETFTYEVTDGDVVSTQTIQVTITGSNDGPVAQAETVAGGEDAGQLTGNLDAADVDGDDLTFSLQGDGEGEYGQLTVNADGSYTFDIAEAAQGLDDGESAVETFTYEVTDGDVVSTQTITVTITGSNDGPVAQAETVSGNEDAGQLTGNLDAADVDGDDLTFSLQGDGEGQYGQLTVNADGSYTFDIAEAAQGLDDGESAVETFTYEVTDGDVTSTQTITVTITGSNDGPVAQAETVSGNEDAGQLTGNLDAADVDGDDLTFSLQGDGEGQYGQLTVNADGSYTFDIAEAAQGLDDGESAVETFTYEVTDGDVTTTQTITVTITGSNDGPVAQAETVTGNEDAGQLTGNLDATDVDGDDLTFSLQGDGEGQYGQLTVNPDGSYTFDIADAAQGLDDGESAVETFTYEVTDGDVVSTQTIQVTITGSNDGPVAQAESVSGTEDAGQLTGNLDAADVDGDELTFSLQGDGEGQYGQLTVNADGSYTFDIADAAQGLDDGESAVETFTYEVTDGDVTSTQTITVTITGSNDGPVAQAESVSGGEDAGQLTGNLDAADVDGDDLTFSLQGDGEGQYGQLTVNADGSYTFDIAEAAQGLDDGESAVETFTYEVTDGDVTSTQTITVTITGSNDGPVAQAETVTGNEDAGQLTGNLDAADVDGDDLTFSLQGDGEGQYGQLTVNADGSYTFDIAEAAQGLDDGESAVETFTYEVTDGDVVSTQTITVTITGSNDGPVAQAETVSGNEDAGQLTGNLDAADVDGDDLTFSLQGDGEGQYGQLTVNADGSYTFDIADAAQGLDDGESAVETFTYEVTDGDVVSTQTITVTITGSNDGPVAQAETVAGSEDAGQLTGNLDAADVDGDDLTFSLQGDGEGQYGQLTVNADGSYTFDIADAAQGLDDGESAVETFTYEVTDGDVVSTQTITVTITGSNDGPVAQAETVSGNEDAGQLTGNLDAADVDGDELTFSLQGDGEGQYGQLTVNADGSYTFDIAEAAQGLDDGESAVETFTYEVTDGDVTSTQTITVTITGSNDGPVAQAETVAGNEDAGQLTGNLDAADVDGDDLTFSLQGDGEGQYGQLTVNADGSYTFDIAEAAQGLDDGESAVETFTYEVTDGDVTSTQTITVTITGSNDGPVAQAEAVSGSEDAGQLTGNLDAADVDGDDLTFSLQGDGEGQYGQLTVNADGSYTFDIADAAQGLDDGESAVETFTYEVTDGDVTSTQTITVTITGSNDGPVAQAETVTGNEDAGQLTGNLDAADVDGDDLTFSLQGDGEGQYGQLTVNADGSYTFDIAEAAQGLDDGESAAETFTYEVTDGDVTTTQTITVTITGSNDGPVAQAETVTGNEDAGQLTGNLDAADVDGDDLTFSLQGDGEGQYGQLTVNADGSYTFDIAEAAQGLDDGESAVETFTYEVTDGDVVSTQTITVTITGSNDGPVAQAETVTGNEDAGQLTGNLDAADVDGDDLTFSLQGDGEGQYGQLTVNADGSYTFDIAEAAQGLDDGESAVETFTYEVTDGDVTSTQTITVTITGSNDGPVAQAETISGNEDVGQLTGNLDAADVDGDDLTFSLQGDGEGQYGQLTVNADGSYTFDIAEAAQGLDDGESAVETFTYEVTDGDVVSTQTIQVTITGSNDGPVAQAEAVTGTEDAGQLTGNLDAADVDGDDLTFSLQGDGEGQYGQLTVNADGSYTFDIAEAAQGLDDGESAVETFTYEVTDGDVTSTQTITVTITGSNDGPVAQAETVTGNEDAGQLTGNLDAADVDGDDLTFSLQGDGEGQYGQLTVNADGSYTFDIADAAQGLDDGESAVETFTYEVTDGDVVSTQTITVTITGSNDGPVAQAETVSGNEDEGQLTGNLDAADVDGDDLTFSLQGDGEGQYGQLTVNADGSYTFDIADAAQGLDDGESAVETFTYEVTDGDVVSTQTIQVTITGSNDGPVAQAETVTGTEDAGQLTGNLDAADVDGDDLTFSLQGDGEGQYGQLTVNADGSYTFDIAEAAQGLDDGESAVETFTYEVTDGDVVSTQTITVTITGSNDGPVAQAETVSGNEDAGQLTGNLDAADVDGDDLTFSLQGSGQGQFGNMTVAANGAYVFAIGAAAQGLDDGESAVETFTYEVTDGDVTTTETITVTITGSNDGPVAQAETVTGNEDAGQLTGNLEANDIDGDNLTFGLSEGEDGIGQYGQLTVNPDGSYTFDIGEAAQSLANGESAVETFTYQVSDGDETVTQTITVTITGSDDNTPPVASPEFVTGTEDDGVINGNSGPEQATVTATFVGEEAGYRNIVGTYQVDADGNITDVSFVWTNASLQGSGGSMHRGDQASFETGDTGQFGMFIVADGYGQNGGLANFDLVNGSLEFRNADGSPATTDSVNPTLFYVSPTGAATALNGPTYHSASAALNPDGKIHTSLETDSDGNVTIGWEDLPGLGDRDYDDVIMTLNLGESGGILIDPGYSGGDTSDTLVGQLDATDADGDDLTFGLAAGEDGVGTYGTLVVNPDGTYAFTLNPNAQSLDDGEVGTETFTWQVSDGQGGIDTETITIQITGSNDGPVASAEIVSGSEDATITGNLDASDVEGDDLTFSLAAGEDGQGQFGSLTVNADGSYSFAPNAAAQGLDDGESATETFTWQVSDGDEIVTQTITVTITGANDGPVAVAETVSGSENATAIVGNLDATDVDGENLTFSLQGSGAGQFGTLTVNADGSYAFVPNAAAQGLDTGESAVETFTWQVTDGDAVTTQSIQITVTGANDGPVAAAEVVSGSEDAASITGNLDATDVDGENLTFSLVGSGQGQYGNLTVNADGSYSFVPNTAAQGLDTGESATQTFSWQVTDGDAVATQSIQITITGANDGPVAQAEVVSGSEDAGTITGNLEATDVDGETLTFSLASGEDGQGQYGQLTVNANGTYSFALGNAAQALNSGQSVVETFTYAVTDGDATAMQTISITIQGSDEGNVIVGTECGEYIYGTYQDDQIFGLGGGDAIFAGSGNDTVDGGEGNDWIFGGSGNDTLSGSDGNDYLTGESGNDTLYGGDGNDELYGSSGNDVLIGGAGNDEIDGGSNDDFIEGGAGEDEIEGGSGDDVIYGDTATVGEAPDYAEAVNEHAPVAFWRLGETSGTTAADETGQHAGTYHGGVDLGAPGIGDGAAATFDGHNEYVTIPHSDAFEADSGTVMMWVRPDDLGGHQGLFSKDSRGYDDGGHLHIELDGSKVRVRLQEDDRSHYVESNSGAAQEGQWMQIAFTWGAAGMALYINGQEVDTDSYTGGIANNEEPIVLGASQTYSSDGTANYLRDYFEGAMDEVAFFDSALSDDAIADTYMAGSWDTLGGDDEIDAGSGDDTVYGGAGDDEIDGGSGEDVLHGGAGDDEIDGGSGDDTIYGDAGDDEIEAGSGDDIVYGGAGDDEIEGDDGDDTLYGDEGDDELEGGRGNDTLYGGVGDDELEGDDGNDVLYGGAGDDEIDGDSGNDIIIGGDGADILDGGSGNDIFLYNAASEGGDTVVGFDNDKDMFRFDGEDFGGFGNYTVEHQGSNFTIIGEDGSKIGFDDDSNTLFYQGAGAPEDSYQTIATVSGDDVTADNIEII